MMLPNKLIDFFKFVIFSLEDGDFALGVGDC